MVSNHIAEPLQTTVSHQYDIDAAELENVISALHRLVSQSQVVVVNRRIGPGKLSHREARRAVEQNVSGPDGDAAYIEVADALNSVGRDIADARAHLHLLQDGFNRSEAELNRARALLEQAKRGGIKLPIVPTSASGPSVSVSLLGEFRAAVGTNDVVHWNGSKARALFTYMVSHRERRIPREQLLEALWPGGDPDAAANSLRVAVHGLRLAMSCGEPQLRNSFVFFENGVYAFSPKIDFTVDTEVFERHWNQGRQLEAIGDTVAAIREYEQAEAVYRGDFIQDDQYEEWSMLRREGLKDVYLAILGRLSERAFETGDYETCILRCQKIIDKDPCREDTYELLIRSYARLRQPGRARRWYEVCAQVLKDELDILPSAQTEDAYQEIFRRAPK
jgi:DNA-binding SARP family transcriptional activator